MTDLGDDGRDTAEDCARHGKDEALEKIPWPMPMAESTVHLFVQTGATHLGLACADAGVVVRLVQAEEDYHTQKAEEAEGAGEVKSPEEGGMDLGYWRHPGADGGRDEEDGEMGGEEVGFEESVEENEQVEGVVSWGLIVGV